MTITRVSEGKLEGKSVEDVPLEELDVMWRRHSIMHARQAHAERISHRNVKIFSGLFLCPFGYGDELHGVVNEDTCAYA